MSQPSTSFAFVGAAAIVDFDLNATLTAPIHKGETLELVFFVRGYVVAGIEYLGKPSSFKLVGSP
jgi:hypothetical protein